MKSLLLTLFLMSVSFAAFAQQQKQIELQTNQGKVTMTVDEGSISMADEFGRVGGLRHFNAARV